MDPFRKKRTYLVKKTNCEQRIPINVAYLSDYNFWSHTSQKNGELGTVSIIKLT